MKELTGRAGPFHYRLTGAGPGLLLISGLNGQARFWKAINADLAKHFSVLSYDQRGCGATPDDGIDWSIADFAEDAFDVASSIFKNAPFAVIGHSTGGAIAQHMLAARPEMVSAAVLSGTWMQVDAYMHALFEVRQTLLTLAPEMDTLLGNVLRVPPDEFQPVISATVGETGVASRRIKALLQHDGARLAKQVNAPTLVVGAQDDRIVPPRLCRELHQALPRSSLSMLPSGGHFFVQTRPKDFVRTVLSWFRNTAHV